jgi:sulfite reductase beta subunit-like hemoprotein
LTDTAAMAERIRRELAGRLPPGTVVGISGCPNNCAHSAVAPVGLIGGRSSGQDAYTLHAGGGLGRTDKLARRIASRLSPEAVVDEIRRT